MKAGNVFLSLSGQSIDPTGASNVEKPIRKFCIFSLFYPAYCFKCAVFSDTSFQCVLLVFTIFSCVKNLLCSLLHNIPRPAI
jgi:hypothetical protein